MHVMKFESLWLLSFLLLVGLSMVKACQPPDTPEGGSYIPEQKKYLPGDRVVYSCKEKLTRVGREIRVCQTTGKWSGFTPFCDSPAVVRNPSATFASGKEVAKVVDGSPSSCFQSRNGTGISIRVYLDIPAVVNVLRLYLQKGKVNFKVTLIQKKHVTNTVLCTMYERDIEEDQWKTLECMDNSLQTDFILIQDISDRATVLGVCEIEVFVKDDVWCKSPPNLFIPNGRLQVSRDKASLQCASGYEEGSSTRLVCEKNIWAGPNLECEEILCDPFVGNGTLPGGEWHILDHVRKLSVGTNRRLVCESGYRIVGKPDTVSCLSNGDWSMSSATCIQNDPEKKTSFKLIAVVLGTVFLVLIVVLLGTILYLCQRKRAKKVVVIYKSGEDGYSAPSVASTNADAEYSTIYYDAIHNPPPYPPAPSPSKPTRLEKEYSTPIDEQGLTLNKMNDRSRPVDIAFGALKPSSLYDSMP